MRAQTLNALRREGAALLAETSDSAMVDANTLLAHACGLTLAQLLANLGTTCTAEQLACFDALLEQRRQGMPVAYLLRRREFMSLPFEVSPDVLIPRPDTELLVETILARYTDAPCPIGLEIGVGSGCISVSLARHGQMRMLGVDISAAALAIARRNAEANGATDTVTFIEGDLFASLDALNAHRFDFVVSNPPYIPRADIAALSADVRDHEPLLALDGGMSGLDFYERLAAEGAQWLKPQGMLFLEIGHDQGQSVTKLLHAHGWADIVCRQDLAGHDRVISANHA